GVLSRLAGGGVDQRRDHVGGWRLARQWRAIEVRRKATQRIAAASPRRRFVTYFVHPIALPDTVLTAASITHNPTYRSVRFAQGCIGRSPRWKDRAWI